MRQKNIVAVGIQIIKVSYAMECQAVCKKFHIDSTIMLTLNLFWIYPLGAKMDRLNGSLSNPNSFPLSSLSQFFKNVK